MQLNLDKNLIGNIVILLSLILIIVFIVMQINMILVDVELTREPVIWNGARFMSPPSDVKVEATSDTLKYDSPYDSHDLELKKTKDPTNSNKLFSNSSTIWELQVNTTHTILVDEFTKIGVIVANDDYEYDIDSNTYKLKGNPDLIEVTYNDLNFLMPSIVTR